MGKHMLNTMMGSFDGILHVHTQAHLHTHSHTHTQTLKEKQTISWIYLILDYNK